MSWFDKLHQTFIEGDRYLWILDGLKNTLIITFGALPYFSFSSSDGIRKAV